MPRYTTSSSRLISYVRANGVELLLVVVAMMALALTGITTALVALEPATADDLAFPGTIGEVSRTLRNRGPENVGRIASAMFVVGKQRLRVDTIVSLMDSISEPGFRRRGFMADQIAAFNDAAIRSAVLQASQPTATREFTNQWSILQTVWSDSGTQRLSDTASAFGMLIRSPGAEGAWKNVRTVDWDTGPALLGYEDELPLGRKDSTATHATMNGHDCELHPQSNDRELLYCFSPMGSKAAHFFDLGLRLNPAQRDVAAAFVEQPGKTWLNGRRQQARSFAIEPGALIDTHRTGTMLVSGAEWGALATSQWINGRLSFANRPFGTIGFFSRAGRSAVAVNGGSLNLTFDASFSRDLDEAARSFFQDQRSWLRSMAVVVLDLRTGAVRAIAEPHRSTSDEPLLSLEPVLIGSAVKPLLASAILRYQPSLASFRIDQPAGVIANVNGVDLKKPIESPMNGCTGAIDFVRFIACSNNEYAVRLLFRSLERNGLAPGASVVPRSVLERSDVSSGLAELFEADAYADRTSGRVMRYWLADTAADLPITRDRSLQPWQSRPWMLFPNTTGTKTEWLARYAFGGWENRWTPIDVAQAYARIGTGKMVYGTFLQSTHAEFTAASPSAQRAFELVRGAMEQTAVSGTAHGLQSAMQVVHGVPLAIYAKTGTLNDHGAMGQTRIKALGTLVGVKAANATAAPLKCGFAIFEYLEFRNDGPAAMAKELPSLHLEFAEAGLARTLSRHWQRLKPCESN